LYGEKVKEIHTKNYMKAKIQRRMLKGAVAMILCTHLNLHVGLNNLPEIA
jgi:hypothetical protein